MSVDFNKEAFDIFISAGQSNCMGHGWGPTAEPHVPGDSIWFMNHDLIPVIAEETVNNNLPPYITRYTDINKSGNFTLSFARKYMEEGLLQPGRKILITRTDAGTEWGEGKKSYLLLLEMVKAALALNPKNRLVVFLWHQGESSVLTDKHTYEQHYRILMSVVNAVRDTFHVPELPFLAGQFVYEWEKVYYPEISSPVARAVRDVIVDIPFGGYVESYGLLSNAEAFGDLEGDHIHFCRDALYKLGRRYFDVFKRIVDAS